MIKYKLYRGLCVIFGARSFIKNKVDESPSYAVVKGDSKHVVDVLIAQGFTEEWPDGNR